MSSMSIKIFCECGGKFKIALDQFGRRVKCPSCGQMLMAFLPGADDGDPEGMPESEPGNALVVEEKELDKSAEIRPAAAAPAKVPEKGSSNLPVWGGIGALVVAAGIGYLLIAGNPFRDKAAPDNEESDGPIAAPGPSASSNKSAGAVDVVDSGHIAGWAWDPSQPDTPIHVDVYDNDSLLLTLPADQFRQGKHRFRYSIPGKMRDGKEHVIRVKISGTKIELKNSPIIVMLEPK
jgi:hypothetical protein